ncbi:MAG: substrate-binding domain-containing protein, partial [Microbacterium sp.]
MKSTFTGIAALAVGSVLAAAALAGCSGSSGGSGDTIKVGLLLPESKTARYESFDRPIFTDAIEALGDYEVVYSNADQDSSKQQQQAESAIAAGVKVLVLDPVDADAAASIVEEAAAADIPVISYDRLISSDQISYYLSFDNEQVGELQAQTLLDGLEAQGTTSGGLIVINGSPTDPNATSFKEGAHSVLDDSGFTILAEYDTPDWSADNAQSWMTSQLAQYN